MDSGGRLYSKVAIVTGGAGTLKLAFSKNFSFASNPAVIALQADVAAEDGWERILKFPLHTFQRLDIVVNKAGVNPGACATIDTAEADYDRMMRVNVKALYYSVIMVVPFFLQSNREVGFIKVSNIPASRPRLGAVWYAASKAALTTANRGLGLEWAPHHVQFNFVQPILGDTPMLTIPMRRLTTPADIGNTVAWLSSDEATMLTGAVVVLDGVRGIWGNVKEIL
ncbi:NAD(P)-binding protein [Aspergillus uvarum CBS 121591]|uniref:NAD(P)-binding protein n=1 Tax=Aspergillus uvarum CBS 121591 TaxID=1448315 RepID=A0A319CT40_9EURO|nr:NAD(P)-binding protein [Aspergillus uvarum CBS 121591]PYH81913.1 NAD(P)-binding protein [Aspergillus uvarum CBS 121591]